MSDGAVSDGELAQVVANHVGLDINNVEHLAVVYSDSGTDHLRNNDHVSEVSLHDSGLVQRTGSCEVIMKKYNG